MAFKKTTIVKFSITTLAFLMLLLMFAYYNLSNQYQGLLEENATENKLLQNQFDEILKKYDSVNTVLQKGQSSDVKAVVSSALKNSKEFQFNKTNSVNNKAVKTKINILKAQIVEDSNRIIEINNTINQNKKELSQLESSNRNGNLYKKKYEKLNAINLNVRGVKILSDLYSKNKNKKIQQIRVCFTLEGNEFVRNGNKKIYVQVVNPKNQIISVNDAQLEQDNMKLKYSSLTETMYNKKDIDVCTYVDLESEKTIKGKYIVNIYNSFCKIGTTIFEYE
ncbi:conserved hypothetical protein [Flavobacterium sp. 9AF]|uniref:hypothetical protein n=1 Tax=Flavobacterium sp. 9AF TaxID=2653142 RepID=UPI0012EEFA42|nr:hypothetical protein [Flavobacterium sp. 9AF]VXB39009.1 conserved hypothetical protein [Flavobacterium sp. 9AF]